MLILTLLIWFTHAFPFPYLSLTLLIASFDMQKLFELMLSVLLLMLIYCSLLVLVMGKSMKCHSYQSLSWMLPSEETRLRLRTSHGVLLPIFSLVVKFNIFLNNKFYMS